MILLAFVSFLAGVLTVAAPCILPLLPVVVGGSIAESARDSKDRQWLRPLVIATSLVASVIIFTLLLKGTSTLLGIPPSVWQIISGLIIIVLGVHFIWPGYWSTVSAKVGFYSGTNRLLGKAYRGKDYRGAIAIGFALGPVFNSCSPTYAFIVATVLPLSIGEGILYLIAYALGLGVTLLLIAYAGQAVVSKLRWLGNPQGWFIRFIGVLFVIVGCLIIFGADKKVQTYVLDKGWYAPIADIEKQLRN